MIKIVSLVENTTKCNLKTAHGLSLYIKTPNHRILFDLGGDDTFIHNAKRLGIDISAIDTVIISHGHKDHGGALKLFLDLNHSAKIYVQRQAFAPHFSHRSTGIGDISLDTALLENRQIILLDGEHEIDNELTLFKVTDNSQCPSGANSSLYEGNTPDKFEHEQNLIIKNKQPILIMGCGHNGIINIMKRAENLNPKICIGGFHLTSPSADRDEPQKLIDEIIKKLEKYSDIKFYTCHCTGERVYKYMRSKMKNINYLSCGETLIQD